MPSSCAFDDAFWVLSRPQLSRPSIAGGAPAFQFEDEVYVLNRTRGRKIPATTCTVQGVDFTFELKSWSSTCKVVQSMRNTVASHPVMRSYVREASSEKLRKSTWSTG